MQGKLTRNQAVAGAVGIATAAGLLFLLFRRAGAQAFVEALSAFSVAALLPALACEFSVQVGKAVKWTAILRRLGPVRMVNALSAVVVGAASTHLVPLRLDEVLRALVLSRREGLPRGAVLGTVALDRVIEVFVAGVLLALIAVLQGLPGWMRAGAGALWIGFVVVALWLFLFLRAEGTLQQRLLGSERAVVRKLAAGLASLGDGLRSLPRGMGLLVLLAGSAIEWIATVLFYAWMLHVFEVDAPPQLALVMALGNAVAYSVPNVPGALGTYEALQAGILVSGAGLPESTALALALACHSVLIIPVTVVGLAAGVLEWKRGGLRDALGTPPGGTDGHGAE